MSQNAAEPALPVRSRCPIEGVTHRRCVAGVGLIQTSIALAEPACLRSSNFWILPVLVLGSSPNTT